MTGGPANGAMMSERSHLATSLADWPPLRLGFRPFYLLAAACAVALMPLWLLVFTGRTQPGSALPPVLWHGHEMLFGMFAAVIVGFLFTAGKTWTGLQTPRGLPLAMLAALWLAARVAAVTGPYPLFALLDLAFLPIASVTFARLLIRSRNYRNLGVAAILGLLALANLCFHLGLGAVPALSPRGALHAGLALLVLLETVIAGRVIPLFTRNAVPGLDTAVPPWRERLVMAATAMGLTLWLAGAPPLFATPVLAAAAVLHAWRLASWRPWATRGRPILWILHLAYAWLPVGLGLLAIALGRGQSDSPPLHALAVGASAGLMLAMMTRSARGHTGRTLQASRVDAWSYRLILLAAALRVVVPMLPAAWFLPGMAMAALAFAAAFLLFALSYGPWLLTPRLDGRDG